MGDDEAVRDGSAHSRVVLSVLVFTVFCYAVSQSIMVPAVGDLAVEFGTTSDVVGWTMSGNLIATALATAMFGRLGDLYGRRRMLFVSIGLALAGGMIGLLPGLLLVIVGRIVQGLGGGIFPLCFGIYRGYASGGHPAAGIGLLGAAAGFGGIVGIPVGSLIAAAGSYQLMFGLGILTGALSVVLVSVAIRRDTDRTDNVSVNWVGSMGLAMGVTLTLVAVSRMHDWGLADGRAVGLLMMGAVVVVFVVRREGRIAQPLIDVRALRRREIVLAASAAFVVGAAFYTILFVVTQLGRASASAGGLALSGAQTSLLLVPGCVAMTVTGFLAGRVIRLLGSRLSLSVGAGLMLAGLVPMTMASAAVLVALSTAVACAGVGLAIAALPNIITETVPAERTSETTGVNSLIRIFGSAVGAQVSIALLAMNEVPPGRSGSNFTAPFLVMAIAVSLVLIMAWVVPRMRSPNDGDAS